MMRVLMTIRAFAERHRRLEIITGVAILASHHLVLSEQGVFCLRVVETRHLRHASPARRVVTALAGPLEGALVWVDMAPCTFLEGKSRVFDILLCVRVPDKGMALYAINFFVRSRERIFRSRMIEE